MKIIGTREALVEAVQLAEEAHDPAAWAAIATAMHHTGLVIITLDTGEQVAKREYETR